MRDQLMRVLDRMLPETRPEEDFFVAGPPTARRLAPAPRKAFHRPRHVRPRLAAPRNRHA